ncbi:MAG TPA: DUF3108 domain-containing protein [Kofleriaceae bacterium]|nr:DUF3108 domain-containing protein [Kofleriaceae bacterium]
MAPAACGASGGGARASGEAAPPPGPPTALPVTGGLFVPGESMRFELSLRGVLGGEATIAVGQPGIVDGNRVIIVRSRVESAGVVAMFKEVRDEVTSWIDLDSGLPLGHRAHVKFGDKESIIETKFAGGLGGSFRVEVQRVRSQRKRVYHQTMPADLAAFDGHSVIGAMRAWQAEEGQHSYFYVLIGRRLWQNTIRLTGRERVRTKLGRTDALRIDGVARRLTSDLREDRRKPPRYYTLWLSDDERRLPLLVEGKTEYGAVRAELVEHEAPSQLRAEK